MRILILLASLILSLAYPLSAQVYYTSEGYAEFEAEMTFNSYNGESDDLSGFIDFNTGKVTFDLPVKSLKTSINKRDEDMYELLEVETFPKVTFRGEIIGPEMPPEDGTAEVVVQGDFTLAGTTRQISVSDTINRSNGYLLLKATWELKITDYNIEPPSFTFLTVDDDHTINIKAKLKKR